MADTKISALPASTVPLAGTEVLPIVQSSSTKQVSVANLTAGRSFDALGMTLTSTDAGAAAAPLLELYRDSASPAASDTLGEIEFNCEDSAGNKQAYGLIHASILSPTSTAEQGQLHFETATAGALTEKMIIGTNNLVVNEIGAVFNVRIEGDTDANLFYTDATNDRIGVGTISPSVKFEVSGAAKASSLSLTTALPATSGGTGSTSAFVANGVAYASSTTVLTTNTGITFNGTSFLVGTTAPPSSTQTGFSVDIYGLLMSVPTGNVNAAWYKPSAAANVDYQVFIVGGNQYGAISWNGATGTLYTTTSDYRLKENVQPMQNALETVARLKPVTYNWKPDGSSGQGFIAHELQEVIPDAVSGKKDNVNENGDPQYQGIDTSFLVATLTSALQEAHGLIKDLQTRVVALENK